MKELVFLLEEPSAKAMLEGLLPRLLPEDLSVRYIAFEGKRDLEKRLVPRLRGYLVPDARFVVLRDQDSGDCRAIKADLVHKCEEAKRSGALVRIACREIESWYLADLLAVERAFGIVGLSHRQNRRKYRSPDYLNRPSKELSALTSHRYQKVVGSRMIGPHLELENTRSRSFAVFVAGIRRLLHENA